MTPQKPYSQWVAFMLISWGKDENVWIQRWYYSFFCTKQKASVVKHHVRWKIKKVMQIALFPSSNRQNMLLGDHWFTMIADVFIPNGLPQFHSFWKSISINRFVMLIIAVINRGKGHNIFCIWPDDTHIQSFNSCLIARCVQLNKKYFPSHSLRHIKFEATTLKMWGNTTINQRENRLKTYIQ